MCILENVVNSSMDRRGLSSYARPGAAPPTVSKTIRRHRAIFIGGCSGPRMADRGEESEGFTR